MQKILFFFFIVLSNVFLISVNSTASTRITNDQKNLLIDEQLQLADGLTVRGYYKQAIIEYKDILKRFPNSELIQNAWAQLAYTQSKAGEKKTALDTYNTFFTKYPKSSIYTSVRINYSRLLGSIDNKDKRETAIKILTEISNSKLVSEQLKEAASYYLAEIYSNTSNLESAKNIYSSLSTKTLNDENIYRAYALLKLAQIYSEDNQQKKSIEIYNTLIEHGKLKDEITIDAFQSLAVLYTNQKKYEQAAGIYKKLSSRFPKTKQGEQAVYYRLECLYQAKKYSTVIHEIDKLLNSTPSIKAEKLLYIKACSLQHQFLYTDAYTFFLKVLDRKNDPDFYRYSAIQSIICLLKIKKNSEASVLAIKFSDDKYLPPNIKKSILNIVSEHTPKSSNLISFWEKAVNSIQDKIIRGWAEYRLALCYEEANLPSKALHCYNNILKSGLKKMYPYALHGIVTCNINLENYKEADKYINQIISEYSHSPVFPNAILTKVGVYMGENEYNDAFNTLHKYNNELLKSPAWAKAVYYFGCINYIRENWDEAEANFKEILSNNNLSHREQTESKLYLGLIYIEKNNFNKAEKLLTPLISLDSKHLSKVYVEKRTTNKQKTALDYCNQDTILKLGYFFIKVKNYQTAESCFNKLLNNKDEVILQDAFLGLAETQIAQKNLRSAARYYKRAALINTSESNTNMILAKLGKVLLVDDKNEEAVLIFQKILEHPMDKDSTIEARMGVAIILAKQPGKILRANRYAMSVFILSKNSELCIQAMTLSIKLSIQAKNFKEAINTWTELSSRFPEYLKGKKIQEVKKLIEFISNANTRSGLTPKNAK